MPRKKKSSIRRIGKRKTLSYASLCTGIFLWCGSALAANVTWNGGTGVWNNSGNWTGGIPGVADNVLIDGGKTGTNSVVDLNISASINNLTIDTGDTLGIGNSTSLKIAGTSINNSGSLTMNSVGGGTFLLLADGAQLTGGGTITLSDNGQNYIYGNLNTGQEVITNVNNTIQGAGNLGWSNSFGFINQSSGLINANGLNKLTIATSALGGGFVNQGTLEATNTGGLYLVNSQFNNQGGTIKAVGSGNNVYLQNTTISGGTLQGQNGGIIETVNGSVVLDGATKGAINLAGTYLINNATSTSVSGTLTNTGTVKLDSGGGGTYLWASDGTQLTGGGTITLSDNAQNYFYGTANSGREVITNVNNTIQGAGHLGYSNSFLFINETGNVINANGANALIVQPTTDNSTNLITSNGGGFVNKGLLEATGTGGLELYYGQFNNKLGVIKAAGGDVTLTNTTISGGLLQSTGTNIFKTNNNATLDGVSQGAIKLDGTYLINNSATTKISGTFNNTGTVKLNSGGGGTYLWASDGTQLTGGGTITLSDNAQNYFYGTANSGREVITNVNNTIQGSGHLGYSNSFLFINETGNVINANGANALFVQPTIDNSTGLITANGGGFVNKGLLEATGTGGLELYYGQFNNKLGVIKAAGGDVTLNNTTISGGLLQGTGTSIFKTNSNATLDGVSQGAIKLDGTYLINNSATTKVSGTFNNTGTVKLNSVGGGTYLYASDGTQLTGGGTITLSDNGQNYFTSTPNIGTEVITNVNNTIQGAGHLGWSNSFLFINETGNVINANGANALIVQPTINNSTNLITANGGGFVNKGLLEATGTGGLELYYGQFNNKLGVIKAAGGDVTLTNTTISGGTLQSTGASIFKTYNNANLDGVSQGAINLDGTYLINNSATTKISGTLNNTGTVNLNSVGGGTYLYASDGTQLTGGGTITLSDNGQNYFTGATNSGTEIITNVNNTIQGAGHLGWSNSFGIVNGGTIDATGNTALLLAPSINSIFTAGLVNQAGGVLRGSGAGGLQITQGKIDNQGTVEALANSNVTFAPVATVTNLSSGILTGGIWKANSLGGTSAKIDFQGANTFISRNDADIYLIGADSVIQGRNGALTQSLDTRNGTNGSLWDNHGSLHIQDRTFDAMAANGGNFFNRAGSLLGLNNATFQSASLTMNANTLADMSTINSYGTSTLTTTASVGSGGIGRINALSGTLTISKGVNLASNISLSSSMTTYTGATIDLSSATAASKIGTLNNNGSLNLGSQNINVSTDYTNANFGVGNSFNNHANVTGSGQILATGTGLALSVSGAGITGGNTPTPALALGNVHVGNPLGSNFNINWAGTGAPVLRGAVQTTTGLTVSAPGFGPINPGSSAAETVSVTPGAAGSLSGQSLKVVTNFDNVTPQTISVTGAAYDYANPTVSPNPVNFGNVHVNTAASQALSIANTTISNAAFQEGLDASVSSTTGGVTSNNGTITNLAAGAPASTAITVGINTGTAGDKSGTATIALTSNGTIDNLANSALTSKQVTVTGAAYDYANASVTATPLAFGNVHVNDIVTQKAVTVANNTITNAAYQEGLDAAFGTLGAGVISNGGSITNLAAGTSNNSALKVGIDTSAAGAINSTATIALTSNGTIDNLANSGLTAKQVTVTGGVYNLAKSNTIAPLNFVAHVGDGGGSVSQALSITNIAPTGAFSEGLNSGFGTYTAGSGDTLTPSFSGSISNLLAGSTDNTSMKATISTLAAGLFNGSVVVNQASNGAISGLSNTALASQNVGIAGSVTGGIFNYAVATINTAQPVDFGNVRIGSVVANQALSISNTAPVSAFTEALNGSVVSAPAGFSSTGSFSGLQAGDPANTGISVGMSTSNAGHQTGNVVLGFVSDGTGIAGDNTTTALSNQNVAVTGNVYRLASPTVNTPSINLFARVGDASPTASVSLTNSSPDIYTEGLNAGIGTSSSSFTAAGNISNLAAQQTNSSALQVGLTTGTAGSFAGSAALTLASTGAGTTGASDLGLSGQSVSLNGKVYTPAVAQLANTTIDFGIVHKGDSIAAKALNVTNGAAPTALNDVLTGSFGGATGPFTAGGTLGGGLAAGAGNSSSLTASLNTASAGVFSSTATASFQSHNADMTDLNLGNTAITLNGQVNNYANPVFKFVSGNGSWSNTGLTYNLNFGHILQGSGIETAFLQLMNDVSGPADLVDGTYLQSGTGFQMNGFNPFINLSAGSSINGLSFALDTLTLGQFTETLTLSTTGHNLSGYSDALPNITLIVKGDVYGQQTVPEPSTFVLAGLGLLGIGLLRRKNQS